MGGGSRVCCLVSESLALFCSFVRCRSLPSLPLNLTTAPLGLTKHMTTVCTSTLVFLRTHTTMHNYGCVHAPPPPPPAVLVGVRRTVCAVTRGCLLCSLF